MRRHVERLACGDLLGTTLRARFHHVLMEKGVVVETFPHSTPWFRVECHSTRRAFLTNGSNEPDSLRISERYKRYNGGKVAVKQHGIDDELSH